MSDSWMESLDSLEREGKLTPTCQDARVQLRHAQRVLGTLRQDLKNLTEARRKSIPPDLLLRAVEHLQSLIDSQIDLLRETVSVSFLIHYRDAHPERLPEDWTRGEGAR